jgi:hypothetical protein
MINGLPCLYDIGPMYVGGVSMLCAMCFGEQMSHANVGLWVFVCA